ncbi:MAG: glycosyltransferase family 39 protein [Candidatus Methanospirareceae archaeon]
MILLFTIAFTLRFITWIYPGLGWGRLSIYDVGLYTEYGEAMVKAFLAWDIRELASINIGVPPLGTLLVGIFASVFGGLFGDVYRAGLLAPLVASSASVICVYLILKKYSHRAAVAASLLFALDPYLIQCSSAYLDAIGTFFLLIAISLYVHSDDFSIKHVAAAGFFMMLAILTKFTFAVFAAFFVLLLLLTERDYKTTGTIAVFSAFSLAFIPWLWFPTTFQEAVFHHTSMNSILPPIIFGPLLIGVPESYPWYILTYFGLGQVHWKVLPSLSHLLFFAALIYSGLRREFPMDRRMMIFLLVSILSTMFIPRNYWTYMWGMGFAKGEGVLFRQFYHYYFYLTNVAAGAAACRLLFGGRGLGSGLRSRIALGVSSLYGLTAPYVAVMNPLFPYWSFIFTLILNFSRNNPVMGYYGMIAFIVTVLMLSAAIGFTVIITQRIRQEKI